jgi:beta-galactosidase
MTALPRLGVCYYPEHWDEDMWAADARAMAELGISRVRMGEFTWSRIEPHPGQFDWEWLDRAIETLARENLGIIMGTPTACPPKWLIDRHPEILARDSRGQPRKFGSRRHYCFSSPVYRAEAARIVTAMASRYGSHRAVVAWQTDNEYGCHDTTISYSDAAAEAFRTWLKLRYGNIQALNNAWGTVFWSQEYEDFAQIDPPCGTVTEATPAHRLDYWRFSSDQVVSFNSMQVEILRRLSPGRDIAHNFMGFYTEFDHFAVARDLDVAGWDSYPLGFTEQFWFSEAEKREFMRQGHPDIAAFHHDLYRGCGRGRMWVMEQQPGPVNWAAFNPAPLPGMVRLWSWEALAHGAELVSYFRWRQVPFAQEQMHAALNLPNNKPDVAYLEVKQVAEELSRLAPLPAADMAPVALVFSYEADWLLQIQPQAKTFRWLRLAFEMYEGIRNLGLDIDIVAHDRDLSRYKLVVVPSLPIADIEFANALQRLDVPVLLGPRSGSKTKTLSIVPELPPGNLSTLLNMTITRVESLAPHWKEPVHVKQRVFHGLTWREHIKTPLSPLAVFSDGSGAWYRHDNIEYLATWPDHEFLHYILSELALRAGLEVQSRDLGVRTRDKGRIRFAFNYSAERRKAPAPLNAEFLLGAHDMPPASVSAWRLSPQ